MQSTLNLWSRGSISFKGPKGTRIPYCGALRGGGVPTVIGTEYLDP